MSRTLTLFVCSLLFASALAAGGGLYGKGTAIEILDKSNFAQLVLASPQTWMVEFYAPWCGHCKNLVGAWEAAAANLKGIVRVGAINCDDERELCGLFGVQGFPTIKWFPSDQSVNPHQKGMPWKKAEDYQGQRSAAAIATFASQKLPSFVKVLTDSSFDDWNQKNSGDAIAILFTEKKEISSLYKAMSVEFRDRMKFAQVHSSQKNLVSQYNIEKFPQLIVVAAGDSNRIPYTGALKPVEVSKFLSEHAAPASDRFGGAAGGSGGNANDKKKAAPTATPTPEVEITAVTEVVDQQTFQDLCLSKPVCALALLDHSSDNVDQAVHEQYLSSLLTLAKKHKKQAHFAWIDGYKHSNVVKALDFGSEFPQFAVLSPKKKGVAHYLGAFDEAGISDFVERVASGRKRMFAIDELPSITAE